MSALAEQVDLRLALSDQAVGDQPVKVPCREHHDKTASLAVYPDHLYCYGCGFTIPTSRRLEALAYLLKTDEREAVSIADRYTNESLDRYRERAAQEAKADPLPHSLASIYNGVLNDQRRHRLDWLLARGLTLETINAPDVLLGHDGSRFVIPIFDAERKLVALRYRLDPLYNDERDIAKRKYLGMKGRNGFYLYPEALLAHDDRPYVSVCEGELDALRLWQEGYPAVSATNGARQVEKLPAILRERYPRLATLAVATDRDEAGEEAAARTMRAAKDAGFNAYRVHWEEGKDVTEALQLGQQLLCEP